jgi:hypothetical protein
MVLESLLRIIFSSWLFEHFELDKIEKRTEQLSVYLSENKVLPGKVKGDILSYGFTGYSSIEDFPLASTV